MNAPDVIHWLNYHSAVFDDFGNWYASLQDDARETLTITWQRQLQRIDLDAAKAATDAMVAGDIKKPFHASDTLAAIMPEARRQKTFRLKSIPAVVKEQRFSCLTCRDTGWAVCWSPVSMRAVRDGTFGKPFTLDSAAVCCDCGLGKHISENSVKREGDKPWAMYDARVWLLLDRQEDGKRVTGKVMDPAEQDRLREFMADFTERHIQTKVWDADNFQ